MVFNLIVHVLYVSGDSGIIRQIKKSHSIQELYDDLCFKRQVNVIDVISVSKFELLSEKLCSFNVVLKISAFLLQLLVAGYCSPQSISNRIRIHGLVRVNQDWVILFCKLAMV